MTGRTSEVALLDAYPALWQRTGQRFATHRLAAPVGADMCRFWANDEATINSHFYSTLPSDCALIRAQPWARDEGIAMRAQDFIPTTLITPRPPLPICPVDTVKVIRVFNKTTVNHRYMTETLLARTALGTNWQNDGAVFCAAKYGD